ncbi:uncharacterized protein EDB91DRAFT_1240394 [Suillus paluster]|uniref:uncharacterized protein n=1 Tax=Suillus paluster TaxID=48578 RepID=UPI001B87CE4B|nr:uncharacterized protein EDB91DRAFT_1240394 [Suillus paluster]KAG1720604.1 hypothetical protein EDB91DRAFT_1240394 [Suillus paluster]
MYMILSAETVTPAAPQFHCEVCFSTELCCHDCVVATHTKNPSHWIQEWMGSYFVTVSLKKLGLRVQLGHPAGERCLLPERAFNNDFTLIDTNGIHEIGLDFCGCETAQTHTRQLLRTTWFLATMTDPCTGATFRILEQYHILSFESKCSGYEFYHTDHYEAFMQMVREWRHLKMLKRAGRGYDPAGVEGTVSGECAVICPACPQPGKNLSDNWPDAPKGKCWLYALFLAIYANFHLKRRIVSKDSADPGLSCRWAYFVEETAYKTYLQSYSGSLQQKSTCSSHNAVNMADMKVSHGLAATGVGTVDCARHNMKLPNGVGNLQKGKRYTNMDFLFFSSLCGRSVDTLNVSYNIVCQWHKNLWQRMSTMPLDLHLDHLATFVRFFIPKFHLPAHILTCQTKFSFNFSKNVGCTDGEAPERGWSNINPVASSTKEMGPGSRRDTLDDHFGDWNWKKVIGLGATLLRKMIEAQEERGAHQTAFQELNEALAPEMTEAWKVKIESWEENPNDSLVTNPFEAKVIPVTQAAVQLKLAQLEASELHQGTDVSMHTKVSPSIFIASGIDLENKQHCLKVDISKQGLHATDMQMGTVQQLQNAVQHKINTWKCIQALYTPIVQLLESRIKSPSHSTSDIINPEDSQLWLPSALCSKPIPCDMWLLTTEQSLRLRDHMYTFKRDWLCGQSANTHAQNALSCVEARATAAAEKYRAARTALSSLAHILRKVGWDHRYKVLERKDNIRGIQLSWIWLVEGVGDDEDEAVQDSKLEHELVEWCKAHARAMRWAEEVELLQEEMRWVTCFLRWHASWWNQKIAEHMLGISADDEGLGAYAYRQAWLREGSCRLFQEQVGGASPTDCSL